MSFHRVDVSSTLKSVELRLDLAPADVICWQPPDPQLPLTDPEMKLLVIDISQFSFQRI